jgi:L-asparagine permease
VTEQTLTPEATADAGDAGYHKALKPRHVNMIAIGGAIGTGGRLAQAGPALAIVYAVCGLFAFFVVRALGELILYRPSSGAFVSYAREFMGEKGAYAAGWMHFLNWSTTGIADITAVALAVVLTLNLVSVKLFGEMEFWFAIVKVAALVLFMVIGIVLLATQTPIDGVAGGPQLITGHGGIFPAGLLPMVMIVQGVVFAYASVELVGVAAGETENPEKIMPKAINSIMWRIAVFYVGSVVLLAMLLPWSSYTKDQSPFVTVLSHLGVPAADSVMNLVVLTAALSSLNSGLYSTGRILRSMATAGSAPKFTGVMNRNQVPYGGILLTASVCVLGVGLNHLVPKEAFDIVLNFAAIGILATWAIIVLCHLLFVRKTKRDGLERPSFRLPFSPYTEIVTLVFLAAVVVLMGFDETGRITLTALPVIALALVAGWFAVRKRIDMRAFDKAGL